MERVHALVPDIYWRGLTLKPEDDVANSHLTAFAKELKDAFNAKNAPNGNGGRFHMKDRTPGARHGRSAAHIPDAILLPMNAPPPQVLVENTGEAAGPSNDSGPEGGGSDTNNDDRDETPSATAPIGDAEDESEPESPQPSDGESDDEDERPSQKRPKNNASASRVIMGECTNDSNDDDGNSSDEEAGKRAPPPKNDNVGDK